MEEANAIYKICKNEIIVYSVYPKKDSYILKQYFPKIHCNRNAKQKIIDIKSYGKRYLSVQDFMDDRILNHGYEYCDLEYLTNNALF